MTKEHYRDIRDQIKQGGAITLTIGGETVTEQAYFATATAYQAGLITLGEERRLDDMIIGSTDWGIEVPIRDVLCGLKEELIYHPTVGWFPAFRRLGKKVLEYMDLRR